MSVSGFHFYDHNGDRRLAKSLGLTNVDNWGWREGGWIYLGTATSDPDVNPGWAIEVEVVAMPAQFWRFTVRSFNDVEVAGEWEKQLQVIRFSTGSGGLGEYYPVASMFATNRLGLPELL